MQTEFNLEDTNISQAYNTSNRNSHLTNEENEISLTDLWIVLVKRKWIVLVTFFVVTLTSIAAVSFIPYSYTHTTTVKLGYFMESGKDIYLDTPEAVRLTVQEIYIPIAINEYYKNYPEDRQQHKVNVRTLKEIGIIILESEAAELNRLAVLSIQKGISRLLINDQKRKVDALNDEINREVLRTQYDLEELNDAVSLITADIERNKKLEAFIHSQINDLNKSIKTADGNRERILNNIGKGTNSTLLYFVNDELNRSQIRLDRLQERLLIGLNKERDALNYALASNLRSKTEKEHAVLAIEDKLKDVQPASIVELPGKSRRRTGMHRPTIFVMAAFLGLFLGILLAFVCEFVANLRIHQLQARNSDPFPSDNS